jgi:hypothetical protein
LIEHVVRLIAGVIELEVRPPVRVRVQTRNLQGAAEGAAEGVGGVQWLRRGHFRTQLIGRCVERRAAESVGDRSLVRTLAARCASAKVEPSSPATGAAAPPTAASTVTLTSEATWTLPAQEAAVGELSSRRIERSEPDGLLAIVEQPAVEARGVGAAADRDRVSLRALRGEARRQ